MLIENEDVEGSILAGLDVYASSHQHLKAFAGRRGSVLSKRFMLGLRAGRVKLLRAGWKVKLILMKVKPDLRPETIVLSLVTPHR